VITILAKGGNTNDKPKFGRKWRTVERMTNERFVKKFFPGERLGPVRFKRSETYSNPLIEMVCALEKRLNGGLTAETAEVGFPLVGKHNHPIFKVSHYT
jgi:hypothetical protein